MFAGELGDMPSLIKAPCCSEFVVSRDRILSRALSFYVRLRDWIISTEIGR